MTRVKNYPTDLNNLTAIRWMSIRRNVLNSSSDVTFNCGVIYIRTFETCVYFTFSGNLIPFQMMHGWYFLKAFHFLLSIIADVTQTGEC